MLGVDARRARQRQQRHADRPDRVRVDVDHRGPQLPQQTSQAPQAGEIEAGRHAEAPHEALGREGIPHKPTSVEHADEMVGPAARDGLANDRGELSLDTADPARPGQVEYAAAPARARGLRGGRSSHARGSASALGRSPLRTKSSLWSSISFTRSSAEPAPSA